MNKDALLATLIGFGIGLVITGILLVGPNILKFFPSIHIPSVSFTQQKPTPPVTPTPKAAGFAIESPLPETIESSADLLVNGTAVPGATVVIAGPADETAILADAQGKYAGKITLTEGKNDITVTQVTADKTANATVTVYYTEETL